jgi:hypothetical protein
MAENFTFQKGWEYEAFKTLEMNALVGEVVKKIALNAIKEAPRASATKANWNQIKKHITGVVERDEKGYYGNVVIENNRRVSHSMLQERGWTDKRGRKHPGRRYLKEALWKSRED